MEKRKAIINPAHYLMGCRLDNWARLLWDNKFSIDPKRLPQALFLGATSLLLSPFALAEALIYNNAVRKTQIKTHPVFILGFWRMGTTYLQNMMSQDPQFAWADPVSTASVSYCKLLRGFFTAGQSRVLGSARPMDNMKYSVDLPLEETFGVATISTHSIIHMIAFPKHYRRYISGAFVSDLPAAEQAKWERAYTYVLKKLTWIHGGKRLLLKSPDNTGHVRELLSLFPDARFLNIYRDPYTTIQSAMHMFRKQMDFLRLSALPAGDFDTQLEDTILSIFERMYRELFALAPQMAPGRYHEIRYEAFERDPVGCLRDAYRALELDGFETARPRFEAYAESQKRYTKNTFTMDPRLKKKIDDRLGFCFAHYGYAIT